MNRRIMRWCVLVWIGVQAWPAMQTAASEPGVGRSELRRDGFTVTFPQDRRSEAQFLADLVIASREMQRASGDREYTFDEQGLFAAVSGRLGLDEVPAVMSQMWEKQMRVQGHNLGRPSPFKLVAVDLWDADAFAEHLHSGSSGYVARGKALVRDVSSRLQVIVNLEEGSLQYNHINESGDDGSATQEIRIPVIIRTDDPIEKSREVIRDSLELPGFIPGVHRREGVFLRTFLTLVHELAEAAFVQEISRSDDRRWMAEGAATWVALVEAQHRGLLDSVEAGIPVLWGDESCGGQPIVVDELKSWPALEKRVKTPREPCLYVTSARVFIGIGREFGEAFVGDWFREVRRLPYAERDGAAFAEAFARKTNISLDACMRDQLARIQGQQGPES